MITGQLATLYAVEVLHICTSKIHRRPSLALHSSDSFVYSKHVVHSSLNLNLFLSLLVLFSVGFGCAWV